MNNFQELLMQRFSAAILVALFASGEIVSQEIRQAQVVFDRWMDPASGYFQYVYQDAPLNALQDNIFTDAALYAKQVRGAYQKEKRVLEYSAPVIYGVMGWDVHDDPLFAEVPHQRCIKRLKKMYSLLDEDVPGFMRWLARRGMAGKLVNENEESLQYEKVLDKYNALFSLFFPLCDEKKQQEALFAVANRLFEYCFGPENHQQAKRFFAHQAYNPLSRMLYAIIWQQLVGTGWKYWHEGCLNEVERLAREGKRIFYLAGGTDLYQLLKRGVYNITVIDPMLGDTQNRYYSNGWEYLIKSTAADGGIGDELTLSLPDKKVEIVLKREKFELGEPFPFVLSSKNKVMIPASVTTWGVYERQIDQPEKRVGTIIFERRLARNEDLKHDPATEALLFSFNELSCAMSPSSYGGWGFSLPDDIVKNPVSICVKQLRKPVIWDTVKNIHAMNNEGRGFISLWSDAT